MGMYANYQEISDTELKDILQSDDIVEEIEPLQEKNINLYDIDKMWDAMHFLLTGTSSSQPTKEDLLSEAIIGEHLLTEKLDIEEFIAYTSKERVKEISKRLNEVNTQELFACFDMKSFKENEIYPDIWDNDDEKEEIIEELTDYFNGLKNFYQEIAEKNTNILVSIY